MIATLGGVVNAPLRGPLGWRGVGDRGRSRGWLIRWPDDWPRTASRSWTCPARLGRRVRMLSTGHGRKSEEADACPWASPRTPSEPGHGMPGRCRCALRALTSTGMSSTPCSWGFTPTASTAKPMSQPPHRRRARPDEGRPPDTVSLEPWRQRHSGRNSHSRVTCRRGGVGRMDASAVVGECQSRRVPSTV
jgi:hypothetical protein